MSLTLPRALLLDFGGVVVQTTRRDSWADELAADVCELLRACHCDALDLPAVRRDILAGAAADSAWKDAMSRIPDPAELTPVMFWRDFVAIDWPEQARTVVATQAWPLCRRMGELRSQRQARAGLIDLLSWCEDQGLPVGIVSNALSGIVHRDWLTAAGLDKQFALQIYSDEIGIRKPHPDMIGVACRSLGITPDQAWYVGDNFDRDVVCGRRAGVGATILMIARDTHDKPFEVAAEPDAVVDDPAGLLDLLKGAVA
ncbi:MAG: HAD-IA family hydrolase [Hamadaea sp.]|uniref:HAD family hydrolase n=1 Tax=Hamadaea sp. NPDC050747 TaxID=3155789 RepID=UPI0017BC08C5|nr:HAD-IA family hydrolase [Hamadaea sp.]NUR50565.1 HAD-IA family hydrolase [Hamadaea sp.]NUT06265.1 HAD-IA family hydrolase [Hamadaea sp.]